MVDWEKKKLPEKNKLIFLKSSKKIKNIIKSSSISLNPEDNPHLEITSLGNAFINPAYLWRDSDILDKIIEPTFARAVHQIQSRLYPNFVFSINSGIYYEMIYEAYPELFNTIQKFVDEQLWEIIGGEWVEMNLNLPNGESIIRQRLIGQRFYAKNFYQIAKISWYNNTYSLKNSIPQILAKSGSEFLYLNNPTLNLTLKNFPFLHFIWESPDKSQIMTTCSKRSSKLDKILPKLSDDIIPLFLKPYGGDDKDLGVDPLKIVEKMIWEELGYIKNQSITKFFSQLKNNEKKLPIWQENISFRNLNNSLTSVGMVKENNHTAEIIMYQAEILSVLSGLLGGSHFQDEFNLDWKRLLLFQAVKIIEGKSICEVYRDVAEEYNSIFHHIASSQENSLMTIAHTLKNTLKHEFYSIFNPSCWQRGGYITVLGPNYNHAFDKDNAPLLVQKVAFSPYVYNREIHLGLNSVPGTDYLKDFNKLANDLAEININIQKQDEPETLQGYEDRPKKELLVYIPSNSKVGSFGIENISFLKSPPKPQKFASQLKETNEFYIFSNMFYTAKVSKLNGKIIHVSNDSSSSNIINEECIGYKFYQDDKSNCNPIPFPELQDILIEESGPIRYTLLVKYNPTKNKSLIHTRYCFYHESPSIYGETLVEWVEKFKTLNLNIGTKIQSSKISLGSQYFIDENEIKIKNSEQIEESERKNIHFQQFAFWENKNQNFGNFIGLAVYSQTKYCLTLQNENKELLLLNSTKFPNPDKSIAILDEDIAYRSKYNDQGFHRIPWALEFYSESKEKMDILRSAIEYNVPMILAPTNAVHESISFFQIDQSNVLITTIKEIEQYLRDAPDWFYNPGMAELVFIIRCVEYDGKLTNCEISVSQKLNIKKVQEVDLLERIKNNGIVDSDLEYSEKTIKFSINPYEIKSILVIGRIPLEE
jgi:alpha-mannosidase